MDFQHYANLEIGDILYPEDLGVNTASIIRNFEKIVNEYGFVFRTIIVHNRPVFKRIA